MQNRPLSPHLQVYRLPLTAKLSILHRATGIILAAGSPLVVWWFWAVMSGADSYAVAHGFFNGIVGKLLLFAWTLCMFYHLCNGVRHLVWDAGYGLRLNEAALGGKIVVGAAVLLTLLAWLL